jgi:hypothetical protein
VGTAGVVELVLTMMIAPTPNNAMPASSSHGFFIVVFSARSLLRFAPKTQNDKNAASFM